MAPQVSVLERLESLDDPAILLSDDHRILATNKAYRARYGDRIELGQSHCYDVSHGYDRPCDLKGETCPARACRATGRASHVTHVHRHGDREEICDIELQPVEDARGEVVQFIEILRPARQVRSEQHGLVGRSASFRVVLDLVDAVADSELPVLLLGETGTGKEKLAEAIHKGSSRRDGPLVAVECPGIQESLFESELFGHERGAFTGADRRRDGLVDAARSGTLFLDEIGDLSLAMQVKLLRFLETGTYRRVGGTRPLRSDFRLLAATHRDLAAMVAEGTFRSDLYYRLAVYPVKLPSLRDRLDDVVPLARHLLGDRARLTPAAEAALTAWRWPGNIRELRNAMHRAAVLSRGRPIEPVHLPPALTGDRPRPPVPTDGWPWGDAVLPLDEVVTRYLTWVEDLELSREELAQKLGLSRRQLYRKLARLHGETDRTA